MIVRSSTVLAAAMAMLVLAPYTRAATQLPYSYAWTFTPTSTQGSLAATEWDGNNANNTLLNDGQVSPNGVNGWGAGQLGGIVKGPNASLTIDLGSAQSLDSLLLMYNVHYGSAVVDPAAMSVSIDGGTPIVYGFPSYSQNQVSRVVPINLTGNTGQVLTLQYTQGGEWTPFSEIQVLGVTPKEQVVPSSYTLNTAPTGSYVDPGLTDLTDGVGKGMNVWPNPVPDNTPLVGWQNTNPSITFNFDTAEYIESILVYMADSGGASGVGLPLTVQVTTTGGYDRTFLITDPAGNGTAAGIRLPGIDTLSDNFTLTITRRYEWTMLTEVEFFVAVPTPAALPAGLAMIGLLAARRRRR